MTTQQAIIKANTLWDGLTFERVSVKQHPYASKLITCNVSKKWNGAPGMALFSRTQLVKALLGKI